jgi:hypothetical protein
MNKQQPVRKCAGSNSFNGFHMCKERKVDRKKQRQKNAMAMASDQKKDNDTIIREDWCCRSKLQFILANGLGQGRWP